MKYINYMNKGKLSACLILLVTFASIGCAPTGFSVTGTAEQIERGKDGYTAIVVSNDNKRYHAVISRVNMQEDYKEIKIGDKATFMGDTTHVGTDVYMKVRKIE